MFVIIVVGEIVWGIGVGWMMLRLRRWIADPRIEITLSVLTPLPGLLATRAAWRFRRSRD
jgi:hypothetical protein